MLRKCSKMNLTYLGPVCVCVCVCVCETHTHTVCLTQQEKDNKKTKVSTKIHRHLGADQYKDLFKHEDREFSINQMKHMLDHVMCKFEDSGKKTVTNSGRCQSGRNDGDLTSYEQACKMLCGNFPMLIILNVLVLSNTLTSSELGSPFISWLFG